MLKSKKGNKLIVLIITIIVLLILAGVSISLVAGDSGILSKALDASENTRAGVVEEEKYLWENEKKMAQNDENSSVKVETQEELLERLVKNGSLTNNEKTKIEETGEVTIGNKTIVFEKKEDLYSVIYTDGAESEVVFSDQVYNGLKENDDTPIFVGTPNRIGYIFLGWAPAINSKISKEHGDSDRIIHYTATWKKDDNTYTVTYTDDVYGTVVFPDQGFEGLKRGNETPQFLGNCPQRDGYTFIGWLPEVSPFVTGDIVYKAQWKNEN